MLLCGTDLLAGAGGMVEPPPSVSRAAFEVQVLATIRELDSVEGIAGALAIDNANDVRVREFGRRLLLDRSAIGPLWMGFGAAHRLPEAPATPGAAIPELRRYQDRIAEARVAALTTLPTLKGGSFDREFLRLVESADKTGLAALAWARRQLPDSDLTPVIDDVIPFYRQHYTIAARLALEQAMRQGGR
jgi:hypothetical protein